MKNVIKLLALIVIVLLAACKGSTPDPIKPVVVKSQGQKVREMNESDQNILLARNGEKVKELPSGVLGANPKPETVGSGGPAINAYESTFSSDDVALIDSLASTFEKPAAKLNFSNIVRKTSNGQRPMTFYWLTEVIAGSQYFRIIKAAVPAAVNDANVTPLTPGLGLVPLVGRRFPVIGGRINAKYLVVDNNLEGGLEKAPDGTFRRPKE